MAAPQYTSCKITRAVGKPSFDRQGGISKLYLFSYVKYSKSLNLVEGQKVITFPSTIAYEFEAEGMSFSESTSVVNGGVEWTQNLSFKLTKSSEDSQVHLLPNKDYSAVILDRNGDYRFIGMRNGAEVTVSSTTGSSKRDMNGYSVSLTAKEDNQAYYIPDFKSLFTVVSPIEFICPARVTNLRNSIYYGGSSINIEWDAAIVGTLPVEGYYVYVNNSYNSTLGGGLTNTRITDLEAGEDFSIFVKAYDTEGNIGPSSNVLNVSTLEAGFAFRVANDNGRVEALECIPSSFNI